jgi:hypothetical protein
MSKRKIRAFEQATLKFFEEHFATSVRHLRLDLEITSVKLV